MRPVTAPPTTASASIVSCGGPPPKLVLPAGGGVDIEFVNSAGAPTDPPSGQFTPPVDNLYLPGLGKNAALETAPVSDGHQVLQQLGPGTLQIDGTNAALSCQGASVVPVNGGDEVYVTVTPGATTKVTCAT